MNVRDNLKMGAFIYSDRVRTKKMLDRIYTIFPRLKERTNQMGGTLSGGEQQMLAIARCLMSYPRLILLDEPSEGLAPMIIKDLEIQIQTLKNEGTTFLLCEQNLDFSLRLSDRAYIIEKGTIKYEGRSADLENDQEVKERYLGVIG
jgi:branched-chain amino acid transport system ATP-binding protein